MKRRYVTFLLAILLPGVLFAKENTNSLANESSPYLLQHQHNPVHWYPWSSEILQKAAREHKAVFLSIGYSTCHWCHVMAKESFTNEKVARLLNKYFISIKVDREELPQVDAYFQNIYYNFKGKRGGWPLNIFMTPNKEVFYISGYIPLKTPHGDLGFMQLVEKMHRLYDDKAALHKALLEIKSNHKNEIDKSNKEISLQTLKNSLLESYNEEYKGFGTSHQFPLAKRTALLFDVAYFTDDEKLKNFYFETLDIMALGGLYDHVDGGFFRYCVDREWEIPHFEKMLYNQAELSELYTKAYLQSGKQLYKDVVEETISMVKKHFRTEEGLFYSASDAQSDKGDEGGYYTFTKEEVQSILSALSKGSIIEDALGFRTSGNINERVHIGFDTSNRPESYKLFQKSLQDIRKKKNFPFIDKKINTAWNAMMIKALFQASVIDQKYKIEAQHSLDALINTMYKNSQLYHQTVLPNPPQQKALLEDYSFLIAALIAGYEQDYQIKKLLFAQYLFLEAKRLFYKQGSWYLSRQHAVEADYSDKHYTSPASQMLQNALELAALTNSRKYLTVIDDSWIQKQKILKTFQSSVPTLAQIYIEFKKGIVVLKSSRQNLFNNFEAIAKISYPYLLKKDVKNKEYLACTQRLCFAKEKEFKAIVDKIEEYK